MMVFVLQHAQNRLEQATQLKLDELIDALPGADNGLIKGRSRPRRRAPPAHRAQPGPPQPPPAQPALSNRSSPPHPGRARSPSMTRRLTPAALS
jgi:hypothetical protein